MGLLSFMSSYCTIMKCFSVSAYEILISVYTHGHPFFVDLIKRCKVLILAPREMVILPQWERSEYMVSYTDTTANSGLAESLKLLLL